MLPVASASDLVTRECRGCRNVQRREVASGRNADEDIATVARETREAPAFGPDDDDDRLVGEVELEQAAITPFVETDRPTPGPRRALDRGRYAPHERDGQVLDRAGCRLGDDGRDAHR